MIQDLDLPLGRDADYPETYAPGVLRAIPRQRVAGAGAHGADHWTAHELTWLDARGRPACGVLELRIPSVSPAFVESKSLKLYLGSFAMSRMEDAAAVAAHVRDDLGRLCGTGVEAAVLTLDAHAARGRASVPLGECIDDSPIACDTFAARRDLPRVLAGSAAGMEVRERLHSHLLRSLCPVTRQPDHGTLVVDYLGPPLDRAQLLRYLVGYRHEACFHEQVVETIHADIMATCAPRSLTVMGLYCRRGGIDIVPVRSTEPWSELPPRTLRQ